MKLFLTLILGLLPAITFAEDRPHLVIFFSDDHSLLDCSVYGATDVRTPAMQRLANDGMTFTRAFVASPSCAPSRAALLTGLMPARNGAEANHSYPKPTFKSWPGYLQELGYEVAAFGKVAHGRKVNRYGFNHQGRSHNVKVVQNYLTKRDRSKPLCLLVGTNSPHVAWPENQGYQPKKLTLPPTHYDTPETREFRARYYTDVTKADRELGELYTLTKKMLPKNTLFIYTSDHGAQWPFGKWNLYDAGIRTPFLAVWPNVIKPGTETDAMISWVDILPTFIELAGGTPPETIDGRSFANVLKGKADTHRDRIFTTHSGDGSMNVYPIRSVRDSRFKYIWNLHPEYQYTTHIDKAQGKDGLIVWNSWLAAAETDPQAAHRVKRYYQRPSEELYDLQADPYEQNNLAADPKFQQERKRLRMELNRWMKSQGDQKKVFNTPHIIGPGGPKPIPPVSPKAK